MCIWENQKIIFIFIVRGCNTVSGFIIIYCWVYEEQSLISIFIILGLSGALFKAARCASVWGRFCVSLLPWNNMMWFIINSGWRWRRSVDGGAGLGRGSLWAPDGIFHWATGGLKIADKSTMGNYSNQKTLVSDVKNSFRQWSWPCDTDESFITVS